MCDNNRDLFIETLHNVLLAPDLCNNLFSILTLMNSGHTCLFHKGFCTVYFRSQGKNIELRIDPDYFFTSCQIFSMSKKARSKTPLKPKAPFKCVFYGYNTINSTKKFDK